MKKFLINLYDVAATEWNFIRRDKPLIVIFVVALIAYSLVYSLIYAPEIYSGVKIAIVDNDNTAESRKMARALDASPHIALTESAPSLEAAKQMFLRHEISGIIVIPRDFERDILRGIKTNFAVYTDASYFLAFKQAFFGAIDAMLSENNRIELNRFEMAGKSDQEAKFLSEPVQLKSQTLFNRYTGYATFIMPCVLILIIQQTLLIGIGMLSGVWEERKLYPDKWLINGKARYRLSEIAFGKMILYVSLEMVLFCYILFIEYKLFNFPYRASTVELFQFILPYFISSIFLAITLSPLFRFRETSLITYFATSLPLLMLTGISWSETALPEFLVWFGKLIPSTPAVAGFVRMQTMGASLNDVSGEYIHLWVLCLIFFVTSLFSIRSIIRRNS